MQFSEYALDYGHCKFDFDKWNPLQLKCLPFFCQHKNLVVSANVASGKTAIAEAIIGYETDNDDFKAVYVSPLKALSYEKYEDWIKHSTFSERKIDLLDSDHHPDDIDSSRIVIATIESLDIACRSKQKWLQNVNVLVFDEAHLIGSNDRGSVSEAMLMGFSKIVPNARLILLSGTMSNSSEMAIWLNHLNNLETSFIYSNWRPTVLHKKIEVIDGLNSQISFICNKIESNPDEKILIFVHSKKIGKILVESIKKKGLRCAFFSSDLNEKTRTEIILRFRSKISGLDVLVATSSLSMGVSL